MGQRRHRPYGADRADTAPIRLPSGNTLLCRCGHRYRLRGLQVRPGASAIPTRRQSSDIRLHRPLKAMRKLNGNTIIVDQGMTGLSKSTPRIRFVAIRHHQQCRHYQGCCTALRICRCSKGHFLLPTPTTTALLTGQPRRRDYLAIWQSSNKLGSGYGSHANQLNAPTQAFRLPNGNPRSPTAKTAG